MKTKALLLQPAPAVAFVHSDHEDFGGRRGSFQALIEALHHAGRTLTRGHRRRAAIAQLRRLGDRRLAELGIRREQVPAVVDAILERERDKGARQRADCLAGSCRRLPSGAARAPQ